MQGGQDQDLKAASTAKLVQDQSKLLVIVSKDKKGYRSLAKCLPSTHKALGSINTGYHIIEKT